MGLELDSLEVRVQSQSESAAAGLDKLISSLTQLRSAAKGGAGLSSTVNQLTRLSDALGSLGNTKGLANLATALQPLQSVQKASGFTSTVNALKKLPEITKALSSQELQKFGTQIKLVAKYMAPLATEMEKVSKGFSAFPVRIQKIIQGNSGLAASNKKTASSFGLFNGPVTAAIAKLTAYGYVVRRIVSFLADSVMSINEYVENVNLFQVAMGDYYDEAFAYAQLVNEKLGVDPSQWMRTQGVFQSIANGFGIAKDQAYALSEGLTELSYDLSSLYNEDMESSALRLQSALAGEIEPIRRLGISITEATLKEFALSKGITKSVESMTEQEKALLRTIKLMEGAANIGAIGDFARTLESPANALRVLNQQIVQFKRAIGSVLLPVIIQVLPYIQAFVEIITEAIAAFATLVGFTMPEWDAGDWGSGISGGASDATDAVEDTTSALKELKNATLGIDELNILAPSGGGGSGADVGGGSDWTSDLEIPDIWDKDALAAMSSRVDEIKEKLRPLLELALAIGAALLAWKLAKGLIKGLETIQALMRGLATGTTLGNFGLFLGLLANFFDNVRKFIGALRDIAENGASIYNITDLISGFAGALGDALILLGKTKLGGALEIVSGIAELVHNIADIAENGVNVSNVLGIISAIGALAIGIGAITGNTTLLGAGLVIRGITNVVKELAENWEAIKRGDWSGVDKVTLIVGALQIIGGLIVAVAKFNATLKTAKAAESMAEAAKTISDTGTATSTLSGAVGDTGSGGLTTKLVSLAKNLGLGIVIIAEVAAAALLVVGAVALLGSELRAVGDAWQPVIENGGTTAAAVLIGSGIIAAVGLAAYGLGTLGATAAVNIGIGIGILAEIGIAAGLFFAEIWLVGEELTKIRDAWQPVLDNGEEVAAAVAVGTGLLVAVGVATAAIGAVVAGTGGLTIPLLIAAGTAVLVELAGACVALTESVSSVADELADRLAPSLRGLNETMPQLTEDVEDFVDFMSVLASEISDYTGSMGSITWSSIVGSFQRLFAGSPIAGMADDVAEIADDTEALNDKLRIANPELEQAIDLMSDYVDCLDTLQGLIDKSSEYDDLGTGLSTSLREYGRAFVTGFANGLNDKAHLIGSTMAGIGKSAVASLKDSIEANKNSARNALANIFSGVSIKLPHFRLNGSFNLAANTVPTVSIKWYASGGFPDVGQLFLARESGPELVGQIGRQTAVANNDQIVAGIAYGVESANEPLISAVYAVAQQIVRAVEAGGDVYMDGYKVGQRVTRSQNRQNRVYGKTLQNV